MKIINELVIGSLVVAILIYGLFITNSAKAANYDLNISKDLSYGINNDTQVKSLQEFLISKGYLQGKATGNYYNLTVNAVKSFQKANGIKATGYFGPLSRQAVKSLSVVTENKSNLSVINPEVSSVELGKEQTISWTSNNYSPKTVAINIISKTGNDPQKYELVRKVSGEIANDGQASWIPSNTELGKDVYVEVGCVLSDNACASSVTNSAIAVINSNQYKNTANAFQSIESLKNK